MLSGLSVRMWGTEYEEGAYDSDGEKDHDYEEDVAVDANNEDLADMATKLKAWLQGNRALPRMPDGTTSQTGARRKHGQHAGTTMASRAKQDAKRVLADAGAVVDVDAPRPRRQRKQPEVYKAEPARVFTKKPRTPPGAYCELSFARLTLSCCCSPGGGGGGGGAASRRGAGDHVGRALRVARRSPP